MSAFLVDTDHIDYLVTAVFKYAVQWTDLVGIGDNGIGRRLLEANAESVSYRYNEPAADVSQYTFKALNYSKIDPVQTLKAIACWQYQTCENPDYAKSGAWTLMERLQAAAINALPGYDSAKWEWSRNSAA